MNSCAFWNKEKIYIRATLMWETETQSGQISSEVALEFDTSAIQQYILKDFQKKESKNSRQTAGLWDITNNFISYCVELCR